MVYLKEGCLIAANVLPKLVEVKDLLGDLGKANLLIGGDWEKARKRYFAIIQEE